MIMFTEMHQTEEIGSSCNDGQQAPVQVHVDTGIIETRYFRENAAAVAGIPPAGPECSNRVGHVKMPV